MEQALPGASVSDRYREHIEELRLPDPKDRHVLAAAIESEAEVIVTFNLGDFPSETLRPRGIRALHPDALVSKLAETSPEGVLEAMRSHRRAQRKPPISSEEYPELLRGARLKEAARFADRHRSEL